MKLVSKRVLERATPECVLSVIRDFYRQQCQFDPGAMPGMELGFDSTIAEWRKACDFLPWRPLAKAIGEYFNVEMPKHEWRALLEPSREKRLKGLCEAIAQRTSRERIAAKNILGAQCETASIFLTIREALEGAGAYVSRLQPDTPLAEYTRSYPRVFLQQLGRLFPGRLPEVKISTPLRDAGLLLLGLSSLALILGAILGAKPLRVIAVVGLVVSGLAGFVARRLKPKSVDFGDLETFRDLVNALSDDN